MFLVAEYFYQLNFLNYPQITHKNFCTKKEGLKPSNNGGKNASYIEPFINTLKEQLLSKSSTKLIYMLNQWASKYAA